MSGSKIPIFNGIAAYQVNQIEALQSSIDETKNECIANFTLNPFKQTRLYHYDKQVYRINFEFYGYSVHSDGRILDEDAELQQEIKSALLALLGSNFRGGPLRTDNFIVVPSRKLWAVAKTLEIHHMNQNVQLHPYQYTVAYELIDPMNLLEVYGLLPPAETNDEVGVDHALAANVTSSVSGQRTARSKRRLRSRVEQTQQASKKSRDNDTGTGKSVKNNTSKIFTRASKLHEVHANQNNAASNNATGDTHQMELSDEMTEIFEKAESDGSIVYSENLHSSSDDNDDEEIDSDNYSASEDKGYRAYHKLISDYPRKKRSHSYAHATIASKVTNSTSRKGNNTANAKSSSLATSMKPSRKIASSIKSSPRNSKKSRKKKPNPLDIDIPAPRKYKKRS